MDIKSAVDIVVEVISYCVPFSFIWAVTATIYDFILRQVTGKGGNL